MTVYKEKINWNNNIYQHKYEDTTRRMTGFFKLMTKWKGKVSTKENQWFKMWIFNILQTFDIDLNNSNHV